MFEELQTDLEEKINYVDKLLEKLDEEDNVDIENLGLIIAAIRKTIRSLKDFQEEYEKEAVFYKIDFDIDYSFEKNFKFNSEDKKATIEFLKSAKIVFSTMNDKLNAL